MGNSALLRRNIKIKKSAVAAQTPLIRLRGLTKTYGSGAAAFQALRGIDLKIRRGEFVAIMGHSGSGKSTLMNILGCLDTPTAGNYLYKGIRVEKLSSDQRSLLRRHSLGFVFQGFNLLARTSTLENVELPLLYRGLGKKARHAKAIKALTAVGLADKLHNTPSELSGGQQQRVAIARAIVTEPDTLLADEPTGNLDSATSHEIMELIRRLNREMGITILMVTHEDEVAAYARRVVHITDGLIASDTCRCKRRIFPTSQPSPLLYALPPAPPPRLHRPAPIPIPEPLPDIYEACLAEYSGGVLQPLPLPTALPRPPRPSTPKLVHLPRPSAPLPAPTPPLSAEEMLLAEEKPFVPPYTSLTDFLPTEEIPSILDALPPQISSNLLKGLGTLSQPPPLPQVIETPNALADSDFDTQTGVLPSSLSEFLPEDLPDLSTLDKTVIQDFDASFPLDEELDIPPPVDHTPYIPLPPKLDINWIPESDVPEPIISNPEIFIEDEVMNESEDASAIFSASDSEIVSTEDIEATLEEHIIEEELANTPSTPSQSEPEVSAPTIPSFMTLPQPLPETAQPKAFVVPKTLNFSVTTPAVYPLPGKRIVNLLLPKTEKSAPALPSPPPPADKSNAVKILTPGSVERLLARNITQASQAAPEPAPAPSPTPAPAPTPEAASAPVPTVVPAPEPKEEPKAPTVPELVPEKPVPASVPAPAAPQIIVVEGTTVNITQQVPIVVNNLPVQQLPNIPEAPIVPPASVAKETEVIEAASVLAPTDEVPKPLLTQKKNKKVVLAVIPPPKETEILVAIPPKIKKRRPRVNAGSANYKSNRENTRKWTKARTKRYNFHKDGIH